MFKFVTAAAVLAACAWCQPGPPLSFEVASIKPSAPRPPGQYPGNSPGIDRINFRYVTLWYSISYAYGVKSYEMSGPDWLKDTRYDIVAKGREGTRREQLPEMMQTLLAERFKLQVHRKPAEIPGLALTLGKDGPKLKESAPGSGDGQGGALIGMSATAEGIERIDVKGAAMSNLAGTLTALLGRPVVDSTGLTGRYDFVLEFSRGETAGPRAGGGYHEPPQMPAPPPGSDPSLSIYSSIRQLGLKLEPRKLPLDLLVIDHAERTPAEN
jgi:uncharacterized protein (TIGR03435 family)